MSDTPWFKFYPSDWLSGTRGLTVIETGVYINLIAMMYDHGEPISMDHNRLARMCGATPRQFAAAFDTLTAAGKIENTSEGIWNARVAEELHNREARIGNAKRANAASQTAKDKEKQWQNSQSAPQECNARAATIRSQKSEPESKIEEPKGSLSVRGTDAIEFDEFWEVYPKRHGNADRKGALKAFAPAAKRAGGVSVLTAAAKRYADHCKENRKIGTEFVKQARSWLNGDLWTEWKSKETPLTASQKRKVYVTYGTDAGDAWQAHFKTLGKVPPRDGKGGWWFDSEFPSLTPNQENPA